jgi:hypothetical protein
VKHVVIWISAGMLVAASAAGLVVRQATGQPHLRELAAVTAITYVSAHLSIVPLLVLRKSSAVVVFQSAFAGTVLHLFLTIAMGAAVHAMQWVGDRRLFLFLLLGFYWVSLMLVVMAMIRIFRRSTAASGGGPPAAGVPHTTAPTMR